MDTIVALGSPAGESAVALIRLSGDACPQLAQELLAKQAPLPYRQACYGSYRAHNGALVDDVVLVLYAQGKSYTGEAMLEISPHGNPVIVQKILQDLMARGCRLAEPGEFTRRAFLNQKMDLSQAEAVSDLIRARSDQALQIAQKQLHGSLGHKINQWIEELLQVQAEVEAYIDFPEEDLPTQDESSPFRRLLFLQQEFMDVSKTSRYQSLLQEGVKTVIIGAPNAGKSSLLNALVGEERVLVSDIPGTTRDFVRERIFVGPYCIQIMDTAGIHATESSMEQLSIDKTLEQAQRADFFLVVLDSAATLPSLPASLLQVLQAHNALVVENKTDLAASQDCSDFLPTLPHVRISVSQGQHMDDLRGAWQHSLETGLSLPSGDDLVVNTRHATALQAAAEHLGSATVKMEEEQPTELVAFDLREAVESLSQVVGKIDNERMLDKLFQTFCIGK